VPGGFGGGCSDNVSSSVGIHPSQEFEFGVLGNSSDFRMERQANKAGERQGIYIFISPHFFFHPSNPKRVVNPETSNRKCLKPRSIPCSGAIKKSKAMQSKAIHSNTKQKQVNSNTKKSKTTAYTTNHKPEQEER
jgi:hypothetical protein